MRHSIEQPELPAPVLPVIERPRLAPYLAFTEAVRVVVLLGPAGYGKSSAVRGLLEDPRWVHYRVGRKRTTFARFVRGFAQALGAKAAGAQASFPRAWERALQSGSPETVLARWLCEHVHDTDADFLIDDLHEAGADPLIAAFIEEIVRIRVDRRLVITARIPGALPIPLWMATGVMNRPLDAAQLRFDVAEITALSRTFGRHVDVPPNVFCDTTACPVSVVHALASGSLDALDSGMLPSFSALAGRIFARRSRREQQFLLFATMLPDLDPDLLDTSGWSDWRTLVTQMRPDAPFMWRTRPGPSPQFHDRFADYLATQLTLEESTLRVEMARIAVRVLQQRRQYADALYTAVQQGLVDEIDRLLDAHGFDILESGRADEISEALGVIDAGGISVRAAATAIRGYIDARLGRFDTSEAWFALALERASSEESRVTIALYYARELMHQFRDDAFIVLEPYAESTTLPDSMLIDVRSALAQAYMVAERPNDAKLRMTQALCMLGESCPAGLRARVLARAAFVMVNSGNPKTAHEYATDAAPIAIAEGLYDVATSAYTVLYTIAYEIDDDPAACHDYLAHVRDCGIKAGTVRVDLYTLVATYELYSEAGARERLAELDCAIRAVDVNYATLAFLESFLPARALAAGWAGKFTSAQSLLAPTADRQATPLRKALRWSEVALYAAAADDAAAAYSAINCTRLSLAENTERTTHLAFSGLYCALSCWVLGDLEQARSWMTCAAGNALPGAPRVAAFQAAVTCLLDDTPGGHHRAEQLSEALALLTQRSFGGVALLIESLPLPARMRTGGNAPATVGAWLATQRLDALYLVAATSAAAEEQLADFVRAALERDVDSRSMRAVLPHWTPPAGRSRLGLSTLAARIRRLAETRSNVPAIVTSYGHEEDVDARIDAFMTELAAVAPLMAEHSHAVSAWCTRIARCLGLDESAVAFATRSGLVHDIGKIHTPPAILSAARKLDKDEWQVMRAHTLGGAELAAGVPELHPFIPMIRGHHERLDGHGYPDGLRLGAIPLAARIVTVADCFNAMIGRRPYRLPMSPTDALNELDRNRDTQFDSELVDAMIRIVMGLPSTPAISATAIPHDGSAAGTLRIADVARG